MIQLRVDVPHASIRATIRVPEARVCCWGEIDDGNIRWLELTMALAIELGAQRLEVDLRGVSFLDGAVMKALWRTSRALPFGLEAIRVRVQPRVEALFRRVRLDQIMTIQANGEEETEPRHPDPMPV